MRLVVSGGRYLALIGQHGQKRFHIGHTYFARVAHATGLRRTPADEKTNLIELIIIVFEAIVLTQNLLAHLIKQAGGLQGRSTEFHGQFIPV